MLLSHGHIGLFCTILLRLSSFLLAPDQTRAYGQAGERQHGYRDTESYEWLVTMRPFHHSLSDCRAPRQDWPVFQKPLEIIRELLGRRVTLRSVLGHGLRNNNLELGGHILLQFPRRARFVHGNLPH